MSVELHWYITLCHTCLDLIVVTTFACGLKMLVQTREATRVSTGPAAGVGIETLAIAPMKDHISLYVDESTVERKVSQAFVRRFNVHFGAQNTERFQAIMYLQDMKLIFLLTLRPHTPRLPPAANAAVSTSTLGVRCCGVWK